MAIKSHVQCDKIAPTSFATNCCKPTGNLPFSKLVKINFATEGSISNSASKRGKKTNADLRSPYLDGDNFHVLTQFTEKTFSIHKKGTEIISSFPLATNIYKANSDELNSFRQVNKKSKKSVLTLPNNQAPISQRCTVSDINDSEYFNRDEECSKKIKKRNSVPRKQKYRSKGRDYVYDRDAKYCSQLNIDLDTSSTDVIQSYSNKKKTEKSKYNDEAKQQNEDNPNPHDVWAVLRNINRFQFRPSPAISEESFIIPKKKKGFKRRNNRKDMRVVETRTEEYAFISKFEVDSRSPRSYSKSSSFDRITVIDKDDDFTKIYQGLEQSMVKPNNVTRAANNKPINKVQNNRAITNKIGSKPIGKVFTQKSNNPKMLALEYTKKQCPNSYGDTLNNSKQFRGNKDIPFADIIDPLNDESDVKQFSKENEEVEGLEFIYSGNLGSSKAATCELNNKTGKWNIKQTYSNKDDSLNGITKVILSKGEKVPSLKKAESFSKRRQAIIVPPSHPIVQKSTLNNMIPKLTQADVKRRIAQLKFPIVVLGKDQLSSNYVPNPEPTQFEGMNQHVWPYMKQWQKKSSDKRENTQKTKSDGSQKKKFSQEIVEYNKTQKANMGFVSPNTEKKSNNEFKTKVKMEHRRITPPAELLQQIQQKKTKPIRQLKDKMLKLIYKKSSIIDLLGEKNEIGGYSDVKIKSATKFTNNKVDASTDTHDKPPVYRDMPRNKSHNPVKTGKQVSTIKQPWSKARWASDFIDNVIKKIKNGVYYTQDSKPLYYQKHDPEHRETEIQTVAVDLDGNPIIQSISKVTITKKQDLITIPGFDNTLPALEIKTINKNEILVKNCVTNIMVHFDVTIPNEPVLCLQRPLSLIHLNTTESQTNIFKCKTSIINSMLPAELCYIIPKMMRSIIESSQALALPVDQAKSISNLSTLSKIKKCGSLQPLNVAFPPHLRMTVELQKLIDGLYANKTASEHKSKRLKVTCNLRLAHELLPRLSRSHLFDCVVEPTLSFESFCLKQTNLTPVKNYINKSIVINTCMALEPYPTLNRKLVPAYKRFSLTNFLDEISIVNIASCLRGFNNLFDKNITINLTTINSQGLEDKLSININNLMTSYGVNFVDSGNKFEKEKVKEMPASKLMEIKAPSGKNPAYVNNKIKKRSFVKLYRKCKSMSSISDTKTSMSLSKITNLDYFFQAFGATQLLSGVFDSAYSHKIMSSIKEMKSWITDINSKQALLVLLLMNKKETPSLVRFRPVLLQGIAVNRITRAHELDMEIEVIERENLKRLSQPMNEEISNLPVFPENEDILLDELCWIAKTTASDYKRTFDESSEKLLKSLLQRRKKLNPSYLRVMARYVGLGLLNAPNKK